MEKNINFSYVKNTIMKQFIDYIAAIVSKCKQLTNNN